ncbi:MAG: putative cytokinetic ring protein SteA [Syntrophaceticus sp.]|jgi:uncharacterized membrane-anchored protein|nr:putative cytokinetic ring protein SteA [Syntrophaceticus sp.]HBG22965.1 hypothetical protein [Peptococcaceae bacterium]HBI27203.1 hypothetical protein [Peptococcaceae bacterium]
MDIKGKAKVDKRTKNLVKRLHSSDIAVIDHADIDELSAEALLHCKPKAVINASSSITGKYPNAGPLNLIKAGVPLIDAAGPAVMKDIEEGNEVLISGEEIICQGKWVARGNLLTESAVRRKMKTASLNLKTELSKFVDNTLEYAQKEQGLILGEYPVPRLRTKIQNKYALVVVRGSGYQEDILAVKSYIDEVKPVLIGVDGGADALLELGYHPDMIVGDMDSVSDKALLSGAELVVHAYTDGRAPGMERLQQLNLDEDAVVFAAPGTSEDIALLLAYEKGAELIVALGTHSNMIDFLEKDRPGMASTFLVRLKVGSILVDAKGVSKLYSQRLRPKYVAQIFLAALIPLVVVMIVSPATRDFLKLLLVQVKLLLRI